MELPIADAEAGCVVVTNKLNVGASRVGFGKVSPKCNDANEEADPHASEDQRRNDDSSVFHAPKMASQIALVNVG